MAEQSVTLIPGQVATVSTGITPGTTVYNGDPVAAVWVSANPMPGPGSGMRIGPKGSLSWTSGGPVYGAVDSGVTTPVALTLSSNVGSLVNPVDVGAAVAAQLLAKGVPSVLLTDTLFPTGTLVETAGGGQTRFAIDFSRYASINLSLVVNASTSVFVTWSTADGGTELYRRRYQITAPAGSRTLRLAQTVRGAILTLIFTQTYALTNPIATITGTNRAQTDSVSGVIPAYKVDTTQTWVGSTIVPLSQVYVSNGGATDVQLTWASPGSGYVGYQYTDSVGAVQTTLLATTAQGVPDGAGNTIYHGRHSLPAGIIQPVVYPTAAGTTAVTVLLGPEEV